MHEQAIRISVALICITSTCLSIGQSREEMTATILDKMNLVETHKSSYEFVIESLLYQATGTDSLELVELGRSLSDVEISRRISLAFGALFSDTEITDLYAFVQTSAFEKILGTGDIFEYVDTEFIDIDEKIERITQNSRTRVEQSNKFKPIPVDRNDGFYATVDYSYSTDDQHINLERSPSLTSVDISEITKGNSLADNSPEISIVLTNEGARKFRKLTYDNIGKPIAIVIDGKIVSLPIVQAEIFGGKVSLRIDSSEEELDSMIERLRTIK